ncbi:FAD binding domain containing protein [Metarhizium acridum CQMa 102]|uniref:FAD binding domain containing protein n=1 Tax=Metarhizium acridum (strain CQMa 102) TaxID=655827 RepID=E9DXK8_METAQ|nr:FAD binding domain containing protein [Metarhizium acridum CQMa 102]EFY91471.1 FAD binding domain containing protein [Metarhizium acridum CQMa 102]
MATSDQGRHFLAGKTIVVAGAGIAGLAFAIALRKQWKHSQNPPTIIIYDGDSPDSDAWRQGQNYTFSISGYSEAGGLVALKKLGIVDTVFSSAVSGIDGSGSFTIWSPDWGERFRSQRPPIAGLPTPSIRIVRKELRRILTDEWASFENSSIHWGTQCVNVEKAPSGRLKVYLREIREGEEAEEAHTECDVLIAADGANSKIRKVLRPHDGLGYIGAVLRGGLATFPEGVPSPEYSHWAVGNLETEPIKELTREQGKEERRAVVDQAAALGHIFHEPFPTMTRQTDPESVLCINGRDKQPFRHDDVSDMPVVFIGDSNHALSPFAGFGANLALSDACDLAEQLCQSHESLARAVEAYDQISEPRARRIWTESRKNLRAGHSTGVRHWWFACLLCVGNWVSWILGKVRR